MVGKYGGCMSVRPYRDTFDAVLGRVGSFKQAGQMRYATPLADVYGINAKVYARCFPGVVDIRLQPLRLR